MNIMNIIICTACSQTDVVLKLLLYLCKGKEQLERKIAKSKKLLSRRIKFIDSSNLC